MRGKLINKLADLLEANIDEFTALESLDVGGYPCHLGFMEQ
jgi:aldehyde dehydrogenase (NAD+)